MPAWQVLPLLASYGRLGVDDTGLLPPLYWGPAVVARQGRALGYRVLADAMALSIGNLTGALCSKPAIVRR
jgi:hypothetical protein